MPRNVESSLNYKLGQLLCKRHPEWIADKTLFTECTDILVESAAARVDLLVQPPSGQPVAIETEFRAGTQVDKEAQTRLGKTVRKSNEPIESAISVGMPALLRHNPERLESVTLKYASHHLNADDSVTRWPAKNWLEGKVDHLADAIELVSLSERRLAVGANILEATIAGVSEYIRNSVCSHGLDVVAGLLHQSDSEQTTRMAVSILANAFVFHYAIEGQPGIPSLHDLRSNRFSASSIDTAWCKILRMNYWPIFSIALDILRFVPGRVVPDIARKLNSAAERFAALGSTTFHDLTGRMFQKLIADRKFLATFYTLPESAQLLAELAVDRLDIDWSDGDAISGLRVADFACGTGTLISAAQRAIYRRFRRAGGNDEEIHRNVIEHSLIASDIMPAATHITASMLSSPHPRQVYGSSKVYTLPYGKNCDSEVSIGALDLLTDKYLTAIFRSSDRQMAGLAPRDGVAGTKGRFAVPNECCDLVIMNPPFTRPTNHAIANVPVPSFAGFNTSAAEQKAMSDKLKGRDCKKQTIFGSGHAGLASNFVDLAHVKLKPGGVLALVLPFSFTSGASWKNARRALHEYYDQIRVIGIASDGQYARSFSADTGMAECLVVAKKSGGGELNLRQSPHGLERYLRRVNVLTGYGLSTVLRTVFLMLAELVCYTKKLSARPGNFKEVFWTYHARIAPRKSPLFRWKKLLAGVLYIERL